MSKLFGFIALTILITAFFGTNLYVAVNKILEGRRVSQIVVPPMTYVPAEYEPIAKTVYMCCRVKTEIPGHVVKRWTDLNPEIDVLLYDDEECAAFADQLGWGQQYRSIKDGPIRADLWRLLLLHKHGGYYSDIDNIPHVPLKKMGSADFVVSLGVGRGSLNPAFLKAPPNHPILRLSLIHI